MNTKIKKSPLVWVMYLEIVMLVLALICAWALEHPAPEKPDENPAPSQTLPSSQPDTKPETDEPTQPTEYAPDNPAIIQTPFGTLNFPGEFSTCLQAKIYHGSYYSVTYTATLPSGKLQELFVITFGGSGENPAGSVVTPDGNRIEFYVNQSPFQPDSQWSEEEIQVVTQMQEALSDLLADFESQTPQHPVDQLPEDLGMDMTIGTKYGDLHYPQRWKDYLSTVISEDDVYGVAFFAKINGRENQKLFTIHFGGTVGTKVATTHDSDGKAMDIRIEVFSFEPDETWSDFEKILVISMQEDINYLIQYLR